MSIFEEYGAFKYGILYICVEFDKISFICLLITTKKQFHMDTYVQIYIYMRFYNTTMG